MKGEESPQIEQVSVREEFSAPLNEDTHIPTSNKEVRTFHVPNPDDPTQKTEIHTLDLGKVEHVLPPAEEGYTGMHTLLGLFERMKVTRPTKNGTVERRPRLLICGGFVRDTLLGQPPKDIDFATDATYEEIQSVVSAELSVLTHEGKVKLLETGTPGKSYRVLRVVFEQAEGKPREEYEVATFRVDGESSDGRHPDSVEATTFAGVDAKRRDFTMNALFYNVATGHVIDYVGGLADIENKRLRFVDEADKRIQEDKLRMFRYVRFLLRTGFAPDDEALTAIQEHASLTCELTRDRVRDEFVKMLHLDPGRALRELERFGLLEEFLPEVAALRACPQGPPYHMEGDVLTHTAMVCDSLKKDCAEQGIEPPDTLLLAAVLHDIAKPGTRTEKEVLVTRDNGSAETVKKVSFVGHDVLGAQRVRGEKSQEGVADRLRLTKNSKKRISWLIENHQRIFELPRMKNWKAVQFAEHEGFDDLCILARADMRSAERSDPVAQAGVEDDVAAFMSRVAEVQELRDEWKMYLVELFVERPELHEFNGMFLKERYAPPGAKDWNGPHIPAIKERMHQRLFLQFDDRPHDVERILRMLDVTVREVCGSMKVAYAMPEESRS